MNNPWRQLPDVFPYVLPSDQCIIDAFNIRYSSNPDFVIHRQVLPEPFIGNPNAAVYVLGLNPGYSPLDDYWHAQRSFADAIRANLFHKPSCYPFYFFDPVFRDTPGSKWWSQRSRWLLDDVGRDILANNLFCVELFPYHSVKYKPIPNSLSINRVVPSSNYSLFLVKGAIAQNKAIVIMRAYKAWCNLLPEIATYHNLFRLNSAQNVSLSPRNMRHYDMIVTALTSSAIPDDNGRHG